MAAAARPSPWLKPEQRERERSQKREAVLHMAVQFFNERGFHATSLDDVAAALNVTKPTIYHYFGTKDEILFECVQRGLESIRQAAEAVERAGGTGMERLRALMRDYAIIMTKDFGMCVTRTSDHELSPESRAKFRALKREIDHITRRVVEEGMRDGSIAAGDARMTTFAVTGALNWIAKWYDPSGALDPETAADAVLDTLVNGLAPRTASRSRR
jgi:AcrR family transcriptional regulator